MARNSGVRVSPVNVLVSIHAMGTPRRSATHLAFRQLPLSELP
jgi:hypothetical protein